MSSNETDLLFWLFYWFIHVKCAGSHEIQRYTVNSADSVCVFWALWNEDLGKRPPGGLEIKYICVCDIHPERPVSETPGRMPESAEDLRNWMNGEERGGRLDQEDWQLVSVAWPLRVRLRVFSTGLKKQNIKSWNVNSFSIARTKTGENEECIHASETAQIRRTAASKIELKRS